MPTYIVRAPIERGVGKKKVAYAPGEKIELTRKEAREIYFALLFPDKGEARAIREDVLAKRKNGHKATLKKRAEELGIDEKEVENGLCD